jgi:Rrf2 family transcriptional regulator, iron-sulfur cluster assembly transcription factor
MKINTKIRYGLRTMISIATSKEPNGILQKDIAATQDISLKYLDSIISALKVKGLINNTKGRGGGYKLSRPTKEISMWDIYTAFEPIVVVECIQNKDLCPRSCDCKANKYWKEFSLEFQRILFKKTLEQIIMDPAPADSSQL